MKRFFASLLAGVMLAGAAYMPGTAQDALSLDIDAASGLVLTDGVAEISYGTSAGELLSCFKNRAAVSLKNAEGEALSLTDTVPSGAAISCGDDSATVAATGDVYADGRINARDIIGAMHTILGQTDGLCTVAADIDRDGEVTTKDVIKLMRRLVGWSEDLSGDRPVAADKEDSEITMYFDSILHRIGQSDTNVYGSVSGRYYTAKNELEDAQIVLTSSAEKKDLTLEVTTPTSESGATLAHEVRYGYYYDLKIFESPQQAALSGNFDIYTQDNFTDPYPPYSGAFNLGKNESKSFMVQVDVPADAESGYYKSDVILRDSAGNEIKRAELRFYVWNIVLDEETACDTLFCTWKFGVAGHYAGVYGAQVINDIDWDKVYAENFYEYMLKNRIAGYELPYDINDSRADKYMSDPRVTSFVSFGGMEQVDWNDESQRNRLKSRYDKLRTNETWLDKAYIYTVDEPAGLGGSNMVINQWKQAESVLGENPKQDRKIFQTITPFADWYIDEVGKSQLEYLWDYCNGFCPCSGTFTPTDIPAERRKDPLMYPSWGEYRSEKQIKQYGNFQPRYSNLRTRGDHMWWYICCSPELPYANFFNNYQCAPSRMVLWQQYCVNSDGILYWDTVLWQMDEHDPRKINLNRTNNHGDGLLVYDAMMWGASEPGLVPTARLEAVRDGIEDFQYMRQLEKEIGRDAVLELVNRITTDVTHYEEDYRPMVKARTDMGFMLESVSK